MTLVIVIVFAVVLAWAGYVDLQNRRHGRAARRSGDISQELRQQRLHNRAREAIGFRRTGGASDDTYSPDRNKRLGR